MQGLGELRRRYIRRVLPAGAAVYFVAALNAEGGRATSGLLAGMGAAFLLAWPLLGRSRDDGLTILRTLLSLTLATSLWVAATSTPGQFPPGLVLTPAIAVIATLLAGVTFGSVFALAGVAGGFAVTLLWRAPHPPLLFISLALLAMVTAALQVFNVALASNLRAGAAALSASLAALQSARSASAALAKLLSERVAASVPALEASLAGPPGELRARVGALGDLLAESRRALPPEVGAPPSDLERRLEDLRHSAVSWCLRLLLPTLVALLPVLWWLELRDFIVPALGMAAVSASVALLRVRAPQQERALLWLLFAGVAFTDSQNLWRLCELSPGIPPNLISFGAFALLGTATVGFPLGVLELATMLALMFASLAVHGGLSWTVPVVNASTYLLACWLLWRLPRQLLSLLAQRSAEAAAELRHRRRLAATLFHDLANVVFAAQSVLDDAPGDRLSPGDAAVLRSLVARMGGIAASASGSGAAAVVSVGRLWGAMEQLLAARLRRKGQTLQVSGPGHLEVRCDEPLLKESVLGNLLTNAVKFSPPGAVIELGARLEGGAVVLEVADRGPGLPGDVRAALGSGTPACSRPGTGGEPGSGFGLLLATEHVRAMGGNLELEPREGGGLRALLRLPLHAGGAAAAPARVG